MECSAEISAKFESKYFRVCGWIILSHKKSRNVVPCPLTHFQNMRKRGLCSDYVSRKKITPYWSSSEGRSHLLHKLSDGEKIPSYFVPKVWVISPGNML
jgi:hypothetical protein